MGKNDVTVLTSENTALNFLTNRDLSKKKMKKEKETGYSLIRQFPLSPMATHIAVLSSRWCF